MVGVEVISSMPSIAPHTFSTHHKKSNPTCSTIRTFCSQLPEGLQSPFATTTKDWLPKTTFEISNPENEFQSIRTTSFAVKGIAMQEHGGTVPDSVNGINVLGADASKSKKRKKDETNGFVGESASWGTPVSKGGEHDEKEHKKPKGRRKLVFVDPDDMNAPWWWPGMVCQSSFNFCIISKTPLFDTSHI